MVGTVALEFVCPGLLKIGVVVFAHFGLADRLRIVEKQRGFVLPAGYNLSLRP